MPTTLPCKPTASPLDIALLEQSLPDGLIADPDLLAGLAAAVNAAVDLEAAHRADNTRRNYAYTWSSFDAWCTAIGTASLPVQPAVLAVYIGHLSITGGAKATDGRDPGRRASTIIGHVNAIRAVHRDAGLADPADDPVVQRVLRGLRRRKNMRPTRREPMTLARLFRVVRTIDDRVLTVLRDRVVIAADATVTQPLGRVTTAQLARMDWRDIDLRADGAVVLSLPHHTRSAARVVVTLPPRPDGDPLCLAGALRVLHDHLVARRVEVDDPRAAGIGKAARKLWSATFSTDPSTGRLASGPLLPNLDRYGSLQGAGRASATVASKATLATRMSRAAGLVGVSCGRQSTPRWTDEQRRQAAELVARQRLADVRDRALLLLGFALAARRSNLSMLTLGEIKEEPAGLVVLFRKSKPDQDGEGRTLAVPTKGGPFCPVAAWKAWRDTFVSTLAAPPGPDYPAFPALSASGDAVAGPRAVYQVQAQDGTVPRFSHWEGVSGDEINEIVKRRAAAAGLDVDPITGIRVLWGAHSLRRGWLTEAARQGMRLEQMMAHSGHATPEVAMAYIEEARLFDPDHSAAMRLRFDVDAF